MSFLRTLPHSNLNKPIFKIVSGGQTGVDRAALDVAIQLGVDHGGWCPKGRKAEDGSIPDKYRMVETDSDDYSVRTKLNIKDSDGTLILIPYDPDKATGGTLQTINVAKEIDKPCFVLDLSKELCRDAFSDVMEWVEKNNIRKLNIAGPRESQAPGIHQRASEYLTNLYSNILVEEMALDNDPPKNR